MTNVEISDVLLIAPELSNLSEPLIEFFIELAKDHVNETKWGARYKRAVCLLTAHLLTLKNRGAGGAGAITSESVGELSVSYGAVSDKADVLLTTTYGSMFYSLRKTLSITPMVV